MVDQDGTGSALARDKDVTRKEQGCISALSSQLAGRLLMLA